MKTVIMVIAACGLCASFGVNAAETSQMTEEQAKELADKLAEQAKSMHQTLEGYRNKFQDIADRMDAAEKRIRVKFAPKASDDADLLWGKYKRFMAVGINDAAVEVIKVLRKKHSPDFPSRVCDVGEMAALRLGKLPFEGGVIATSFEPPATSHTIFKIGDIIAAIDGKRIESYDDYKTLSRVGAQYTFFRLDGCIFKRHDSRMPTGQPRVGLLEIWEKL